jgi:hypothetical protein
MTFLMVSVTPYCPPEDRDADTASPPLRFLFCADHLLVRLLPLILFFLSNIPFFLYSYLFTSSVILLLLIYFYYYLNCKWFLPGGNGTAIRHTQIHTSHKITHHAQTEHSTQSYTNNRGHIAHNEYNTKRMQSYPYLLN